MANQKTNVMRILDQLKIQYQVHSYDPGDGIDGVSVSKKLGMHTCEVFKTLVTKGKSGTYFVFVIPVEKELDLKKAAAGAGEKSVEMIPVREINRVTGYIRGGCSPIGMKKQYRTIIDACALQQGRIVVSAGKIGLQISLNPEVLADVCGARFYDIVF